MSKKLISALFGIAAIGVITLLIVFNDSKKDGPLAVDPAFSEYVSAFTSGTISREGTVRVRLMEPTAGEINYDEPIAEELFDFDPAVEGVAWWKDEQTIEFVPAEPLPSGAVIDVEFDLEKLVEVPSDLSTFEFRFKVITQTFEVFMEGMSPYDHEHLNWQQVNGVLHTADVIDDAEVESVLNVSQDGSTLHVSWEHNVNRKVHLFTIDSVSRKDEEEFVEISWNGESIGVEQIGEESFRIPSLSEFSLMSAKVIQQPDQYLLLRFSDPLDADQDLNGLISLGDLTGLKFIIESNEIRAYPSYRQNGQHTLNLDGTLRNVAGYKMGEAFSQDVVFEDIKPALRFVGDGTILPSSEGLVMPFEAVNLWAVDVRIIKVYEDNVLQFLQVNSLDGDREMKRVGRQILKTTLRLNENDGGPVDLGTWNRYTLDLAEMIQTEPGAIYRIELGFKQNYSTYPCEGIEVDLQALAEAEEENWDTGEDDVESSAWDFYDEYYYDEYDDYYYYDYDYDYSERDNPCSSSYYRGNRGSVATNVLASDIGIIAKRNSDKSMNFAVTDLRSTEPLSGVTLELYSYQQQLVGSVTTDADGMAVLAKPEHLPFALVAKRGTERGYLRLDDGTSLAISKFDVGGDKIQRGIKGYVYGERGVWRPGDSLYLNFVLEDKNMLIPEKHPVTLELLNPQGQTTRKIVRTSHQNRFYSFHTDTDPDAPTGYWQARVRVGGATFQKALRVEAIKPNRLKISLDFGREVLTQSSGDLAGNLDVKWLHGAIARNLNAKIEVGLTPITTKFKTHQDYAFDDPTRRFNADDQVIFDSRVDNEGHADVSTSLYVGDAAPGMLKANFVCRVFEEGGDFSIDRFSLPFSPYDSYVGLKLPKGDKARGMLLTDTTHTVNIVSLDADGNPVSRDNLEVTVFEVGWRWWWDNDADDLSSYNDRSYHDAVAKGRISTDGRGEGTFQFRIDYPEWGRYLVRVYDPESGHAAGRTVYIDWPGWAGRAQKDNPGGAAMLLFSTNKDSYEVGETMDLAIPTSGVGRALVSIENGSRVISSHWVEALEKETHFSVPVTAEMAPNVYLNVTLVQPHEQTANDLPIRLYGVVPISVEDPATHLNPELIIADELAPEKPVTLQIRESDGKAMTYTVAMVDEGLLDLTRFQTPDPWNHFYKREALGVTSWDMYDDVIGAFGGRLERLLAIGGDGEALGNGNKRANRFKPMVKVLGPFRLEEGETASHTFQMPKYIGSVRTMVIAGDEGAYGSTEKATPVRTPLMVMGTLPRVVGPGESVKFPVNVFALDDKVKNVKVTVEVDDGFAVMDGKTKSITFSEIGDQIVGFDLQAASRTGTAKVKVTASSGNERSEYEIEIDIRNPNPLATDFVGGLVSANKSWESAFTPIGMAGSNRTVLEVSSLPPIDFGRRLKYLTTYPHGCVEQTTSGAFPQLYLADVMELDNKMKDKINYNIKGAINRLRGFQKSSGGLSYWPGDENVNDWGTTYAGHFLLEAESKGFALPSGLKRNWISYQKRTAREWRRQSRNSRNYYRLDDLAQAYRLYTLALAGQPELGAMNRLKERDDLSMQASWRLAAAYQLAGRPEVGSEIADDLLTNIQPYKELSGNYGSHERDRAMIIEALSLMDRRDEAADLVFELSTSLSSKNWHSTQTVAYSLIAISQYAILGGNQRGMEFQYSVDGGSMQTKSSMKPFIQIDLDRNKTSAGKIKIQNEGGQVLYARLIMEGVPPLGQETAAANDLRISVTYKDMNGNVIDVSRLEQGSDFKAEVTVSHPGSRDHYREMALTQIFPSGWEIRNLRMEGNGTTHMKDEPKYSDIRDDRVLQYFDLKRGDSKTYVVMLNAAYQGRYYLPAVSAEAMYDHTIHARETGQWVEVIKVGGLADNATPGTP